MPGCRYSPHIHPPNDACMCAVDDERRRAKRNGITVLPKKGRSSASRARLYQKRVDGAALRAPSAERRPLDSHTHPTLSTMIATSSDAPAPLDSVESFFDYSLVTISPSSSSLGLTKARRLREGEREGDNQVTTWPYSSRHGALLHGAGHEPMRAATMHLAACRPTYLHEQNAKCKNTHNHRGLQSTRALIDIVRSPCVP